MDSNQAARNKQLALTFLDLAFALKMDEALKMFSETGTWWVIGDPAKLKVSGLKTRLQTQRMLSNMHKVLPHGMQHEVKGVTAEDNRVALEVEAQGAWRDGRLYRNTYHYLLVFDGEMVAEVREYLDTMQIPTD